MRPPALLLLLCTIGVLAASTPTGDVKPNATAQIIRHYVAYGLVLFGIHSAVTILFFLFMRTKHFRQLNATNLSIAHVLLRYLPFILFPVYIVGAISIAVFAAMTTTTECSGCVISASPLCPINALCYPESLRVQIRFSGIHCKTFECSKGTLMFERNNTIEIVNSMRCMRDNSWSVNGFKIEKLRATCVQECTKCGPPLISDCPFGLDCSVQPIVIMKENTCSDLICPRGKLMYKTGSTFAKVTLTNCENGVWTANKSGKKEEFICAQECNSCGLTLLDSCNDFGFECDKTQINSKENDGMKIRCQKLECYDGRKLMYEPINAVINGNNRGWKQVGSNHTCSATGWIGVESSNTNAMSSLKVTCMGEDCGKCANPIEICPNGFECETNAVKSNSSYMCTEVTCSQESLYYENESGSMIKSTSGKLKCQTDKKWKIDENEAESVRIVCGKDCGQCVTPSIENCPPGFECFDSAMENTNKCTEWKCFANSGEMYYSKNGLPVKVSSGKVHCDFDKQWNVDGEKFETLSIFCANDCGKCETPEKENCPIGFTCFDALKMENTNKCTELHCLSGNLYHKNEQNLPELVASKNIQCDIDENWKVGENKMTSISVFCGKDCGNCKTPKYECISGYYCNPEASLIKKEKEGTCTEWICESEDLFHENEDNQWTLSRINKVTCDFDQTWNIDSFKTQSSVAISVFCGKQCNTCKDPLYLTACPAGMECSNETELKTIVKTGQCKEISCSNGFLYHNNAGTWTEVVSGKITCEKDDNWVIDKESEKNIEVLCGKKCNTCKAPIYTCADGMNCKDTRELKTIVQTGQCKEISCSRGFLYHNNAGMWTEVVSGKIACEKDDNWVINEEKEKNIEVMCGQNCNECLLTELCADGYECENIVKNEEKQCLTVSCPSKTLFLVDTSGNVSIASPNTAKCDTDKNWKVEGQNFAVDQLFCGTGCNQCKKPTYTNFCEFGYTCYDNSTMIMKNEGKCNEWTCARGNMYYVAHRNGRDLFMFVANVQCGTNGMLKGNDQEWDEVSVSCAQECTKCVFTEETCREGYNCLYFIKMQRGATNGCLEHVCEANFYYRVDDIFYDTSETKNMVCGKDNKWSIDGKQLANVKGMCYTEQCRSPAHKYDFCAKTLPIWFPGYYVVVHITGLKEYLDDVGVQWWIYTNEEKFIGTYKLRLLENPDTRTISLYHEEGYKEFYNYENMELGKPKEISVHPPYYEVKDLVTFQLQGETLFVEQLKGVNGKFYKNGYCKYVYYYENGHLVEQMTSINGLVMKRYYKKITEND